jgi:hypothetical protein
VRTWSYFFVYQNNKKASAKQVGKKSICHRGTITPAVSPIAGEIFQKPSNFCAEQYFLKG